MSLTSAFKTASGDVTFTISSGSATISDTDTFDILEIGQLEIDVADIQGGSDSIEVYERLGNMDITVYDVLGDGSSRMYAVLANALQDPSKYVQVDMLLVANDTNLGTNTTRFLLYREGIEFDVDSDETKLKLVAKPKSGYIAESSGEEAPTFPPATSTGFDIGKNELANIIPIQDKFSTFQHPDSSRPADVIYIVTPAVSFIDRFIKQVYGVSDVVFQQGLATDVSERQLLSDRSFFDANVTDEPSLREEVVINLSDEYNYRAIDIVSRLASQEGSFFGALFGKGYFVNRNANQGDVLQLSYDDILELSIESTKEKVGQVTTKLRSFGNSNVDFVGVEANVRYSKFETGKSFDVNSYILSQGIGYRWNKDTFNNGIAVKYGDTVSNRDFYTKVGSTSSLAYANMLGLTVAKNIRVKLNGIGSLMPYNRVQFTSDARFPNFNINVGGQPVNYRPYKFKYDIVNDEVEAWLFPILQDSDIALIDDSIAEVDLVRPEIVNIEGNVQIVYPKPRFDLIEQGILPVNIIWDDVFAYTNEGSQFNVGDGNDPILINSLLDVASPIAQYIEGDFQANDLRQIFYYTIGGDKSILPSAGETIYIHTAGAKIEAVVERAGVFAGNLYRAVLQEPINGFINASSFISRDGVENRWVDIVYYYDLGQNKILSTPLSVWNNTLSFRDKSKYVEAWTLTADRTIAFENPSAPFAKLVMSDVAKRMNNAQDVSKDAILREIIAGFRANAVFELGANVNGDITALPVNPSFTNRVNLPIGTRLLVVSGDETYDVIVSADTDAGALSIPIQSEYVVAYKGAKVLFDSAFIQSQLLVQPSNVYVYAQSVDGKATSSLNLATTNEDAIASINTTFTANGITNSTNITSRVNAVGSRIVLGVNGAGNLANFSLEANTFGSAININANQINLTGQTNFYSQMNNLFSTGVLVTPSGQEIIRSDDAPTQRSDGSALQSGDMWIDTNDGDRPYSYNGSIFVRAYTVINGGDIQTGTVDTDQLSANSVTAGKADLASIFSSQITINSSGYIQSQGYNAGAQGFRINANGDAEFNDVTVRGTLIANTGSDIDWDFVSNVNIVTAQIGNAQITNAKIANATIESAKIKSINTSKINVTTVSETAIAGDDFEIEESWWKYSASADYNDSAPIIITRDGWDYSTLNSYKLEQSLRHTNGTSDFCYFDKKLFINETTEYEGVIFISTSGGGQGQIGVSVFNNNGTRINSHSNNAYSGSVYEKQSIRVKATLNGYSISLNGGTYNDFTSSTVSYVRFYLYTNNTGIVDFDYFNVYPIIGSVNIQDGAIIADKISINSLNSLTANTGDLTVTGNLTIGLDGNIDFGNFTVDNLGNVTATNANISGEITATSGTLGTLTVSGNVSSPNYDSVNNLGWRINSLGDAEFNDVTVRGDVYTSNGSLGGSIIDADALKSSNFDTGNSGWRIRSTGDAEFNSVTVRGVLDSVTGTLGNLTVNGTLSLGTGGISSTNFNVSSTGAITATSANISGTITSSSGTIGGMTVNINGFGLVGGGGLYSQVGNLTLNGEGSTSLGSIDMKGLYIDANNWVGGYGQDLQSASKLARFGNATNYIVVGDNSFRIKSATTDITSSSITTSNLIVTGGSLSNISISTSTILAPTVSGGLGLNSGVGLEGVLSESLLLLENADGSAELYPDTGGYWRTPSLGGFRGKFKSSDGTSGLTGTYSGFTDLIVKDGLIVGVV